MICPRCGKYNPDSKTECAYCNYDFKNAKPKTDASNHNQSSFYNKPGFSGGNQYYKTYSQRSKYGLGVVIGLFVGLIGLVLALLFSDSYERDTFIDGWKKGFIISIVIAVVICVLSFGCITCLALQGY